MRCYICNKILEDNITNPYYDDMCWECYLIILDTVKDTDSGTRITVHTPSSDTKAILPE